MTTDDTPNLQPTEPGRDDIPDDIPEVYELETLEQLRAIADELRTRIAEALTHRAMTVTQLGDLLGQAPAKIHYHVRELERVGLIRLVATREKSGILEKYYRAVAKGFTASKTLLSNAPSDETFAAMRSFLDNASRAFLRAADFTLKNQLWENPKMWGLSTTQIWVTYDEMKALMQRVQREFDQYAIPRGVEGEEERTVIMMGYDPRVAEELAPGSPSSTSLGIPPLPPISPIPPDAPPPLARPLPDMSAPRPVRGIAPVRPPMRARHMVVAGAFTLKRADLEEALAQNRQLDISAIGVCTFADDVTADLVEQSIVHFRHRGLLNASPEVREALKRKE